jgi:DNA-binding NarL/FixJ family response regulator
MNATNVLLAEGRKLVREGLRALLERHDGMQVIGESADAASAVKLVRALPVDVIVLNCMPPTTTDGPQVVRSLVRAGRANERPLAVVVLTLNPPPSFVRELIDAGATGCLTKDAAADELVSAIRTVRAGRVYLSPSLVDDVVTRYVRPSQRGARVTQLAPKERQVLERIAAGRTTKEIAAEMGVSTKTIETHRRRIMTKLDRHSVAELTKYAVMHGLSALEHSS